MHLQIYQKTGIIGCFLTLISIFLPLMKISMLGIVQSVAYIEGDGKYILILMILEIIFLFLNIHPTISLFPILTSSLLIVSLILNKTCIPQEYTSFATYEFQAGFYLLLFGMFLIVLSNFNQWKLYRSSLK